MTRIAAHAAALTAALAVVALTAAPLDGQAPAASPASTVPRTPWGDPDLQGIWPSTDMLGVPLERMREAYEEVVYRTTATAIMTA